METPTGFSVVYLAEDGGALRCELCMALVDSFKSAEVHRAWHIYTKTTGVFEDAYRLAASQGRR